MVVVPVDLSGPAYPRPEGSSADGPLGSSWPGPHPTDAAGADSDYSVFDDSPADGSPDDFTVSPTPVQAGTPTPPRRLLRGAEQLVHLVGSRLLVGVTFRNPEGVVVNTEQFCGHVVEVADGVVVVERADGEHAVLPADVGAYEAARPGRYVLSNTGEAVIDPDYLTVWDVEVGS